VPKFTLPNYPAHHDEPNRARSCCAPVFRKTPALADLRSIAANRPRLESTKHCLVRLTLWPSRAGAGPWIARPQDEQPANRDAKRVGPAASGGHQALEARAYASAAYAA
jgi:hypothetical protein